MVIHDDWMIWGTSMTLDGNPSESSFLILLLLQPEENEPTAISGFHSVDTIGEEAHQMSSKLECFQPVNTKKGTLEMTGTWESS
jgi:hypothetical protein